MKISRFVFPDGDFDQFVDSIVECERHGLFGVWVPQVFSWDALTALAVAATRTEHLRLGTAVLPTYPTHPLTMAAAAMTAQAASRGRIQLGIGASHRFLVEGSWGMTYERPVSRMRDYIDALRPAMAGQDVDVRTAQITARTVRQLQLPGVDSPPVLMAALGTRMLELAGEVADGVITWLTAAGALKSHVTPTLRAAAQRHDRERPALVAALPVCVTSDPDTAAADARRRFAAYTHVPAYRAVLDREGLNDAGDVAVIGSEEKVEALLAEVAATGVDEFAAAVFGRPEEVAHTVALLARIAAKGR